MGVVSSNMDIASLFSSFAAKAYRRELLLSFEHPDAALTHTEDVLFWAINYEKITGYVYVADPSSKQAYVRVKTLGSLSRPLDNDAFDFYITDRLEIIRHLSDMIFNETYSLEHKRFIQVKIDSQTTLMHQYFLSLMGNRRQSAQEKILTSSIVHLNKSRFADRPAIAFCHNFSPFADTSAYVAAKRLAQISDIEGGDLNWLVVSNDMSNARKKDLLFESFFAKYQYSKQVIMRSRSYFNEKAQYNWAVRAYNKYKKAEFDVVYSRTLWAGSHHAAYKYKLTHPGCTWYAEFSDPISYETDNKRRPNAFSDRSLDNFWEYTEQIVYELADVIIFTNENQRDYMLSYNPNPERNSDILKRSVVMNHPMLDHRFTKICASTYVLDNRQVNIAYFGSFYQNRTSEDILKLTKNKSVHVHIFTKSPITIASETEQITLADTVDYFEFLSLASRMDYLFLNDVDFSGPINPYLPSKLSDYLTAGAMIIAKINPGSPLSAYDHANIIKKTVITEEFCLSLQKTRKV
jgi:hypothetical protein